MDSSSSPPANPGRSSGFRQLEGLSLSAARVTHQTELTAGNDPTDLPTLSKEETRRFVSTFERDDGLDHLRRGEKKKRTAVAKYDTGIDRTFLHAVFAPEHLARVGRWEETYDSAPMGASRFRVLLGEQLATQRRAYMPRLSQGDAYSNPPPSLR